MRLHKPVSFRIGKVVSKELELKLGAGFYLDIHGEHDEGELWDYWNKPSIVRVDLMESAPHRNERRRILDFPKRVSAVLIPGGIFDCHAFVHELNCNVGLLFSVVAAPQSTITLKFDKKRVNLVIVLNVGEHYRSKVSVPFAELKPYLKKT